MASEEVPFHANGYIIGEPEDIRRMVAGAIVRRASTTQLLSPIAPPSLAELKSRATTRLPPLPKMSHAHLLDVGPEIRSRILGFVLVQDRDIQVDVYRAEPLAFFPNGWTFSPSDPLIRPRQPVLALVNKLIGTEALEIYYAQNVFKLASISDACIWIEWLTDLGVTVRDIKIVLPTQQPFQTDFDLGKHACLHLQLIGDDDEFFLSATHQALVVICIGCQLKMMDTVKEVNHVYAQLNRLGRMANGKMRVYMAWMDLLCSSDRASPFMDTALDQIRGGMYKPMAGKVMCRICRWSV